MILLLLVGIFVTTVHPHRSIDVRIIGDVPSMGRVEVLYSGNWGTICGNAWDDKAATVVCNSLGYKHGHAIKDRNFGDIVTRTIWLDEVECQGNEKSLVECSHKPWGVNDCTHEQDAGVNCWDLTGKGVQSIPGAIYTRWGSSTCPDTAFLVYSGYAGGSFYNQGGASNYLCLVKNPVWGRYTDSKEPDTAFIYGVEYQLQAYGDWKGMFYNKNSKVLQDHDVPCAVCEIKEPTTVLMLPGTNQCHSGWKPEYFGYLMAGHHNEQRSQYVCVDINAEAIPNSSKNMNGATFYPVQSGCGSLKCPPYVANRELTCVVCRKDDSN